MLPKEDRNRRRLSVPTFRIETKRNFIRIETKPSENGGTLEDRIKFALDGHGTHDLALMRQTFT
jgi:hypothetical protein